ncbi:MAG: FecR domain-containing protein [Chitinophagaceae bacterium]
MEHQALNILLQKLAGNTILPKEEAVLRDYMDQLPGDQLDALFPPHLWEAAASDTPPSAEEALAVEAAYRTVAARLELKVPAPVVPISEQPSWWQHRGVQAACVIGLIVCFTWLFTNRQHEKQGQDLITENTMWQQASTANGEQCTIHLPDGSLVYLNGGSIIRYPGTFSGDKRQIRLVTGEIFLEVQRNEKVPFIVTTDDKEVKVLGTSFTVQNRPESNQVTVAVRTGKVAFGLSGKAGASQLLLTPGRKGMIEKADGRMQMVACGIGGIGSWRNNEFIFEDATLTDITTALEYRYGGQYRIGKKSLGKKHFKATFRQRSPDEIIRILSIMGDFRYYKKDSVTVIY